MRRGRDAPFVAEPLGIQDGTDLNARGTQRHPRLEDRTVLNGILFVIASGVGR
jgi:hypothetical protein